MANYYVCKLQDQKYENEKKNVTISGTYECGDYIIIINKDSNIKAFTQLDSLNDSDTKFYLKTITEFSSARKCDFETNEQLETKLKGLKYTVLSEIDENDYALLKRKTRKTYYVKVEKELCVGEEINIQIKDTNKKKLATGDIAFVVSTSTDEEQNPSHQIALAEYVGKNEKWKILRIKSGEDTENVIKELLSNTLRGRKNFCDSDDNYKQYVEVLQNYYIVNLNQLTNVVFHSVDPSYLEKFNGNDKPIIGDKAIVCENTQPPISLKAYGIFVDSDTIETNKKIRKSIKLEDYLIQEILQKSLSPKPSSENRICRIDNDIYDSFVQYIDGYLSKEHHNYYWIPLTGELTTDKNGIAWITLIGTEKNKYFFDISQNKEIQASPSEKDYVLILNYNNRKFKTSKLGRIVSISNKNNKIGMTVEPLVDKSFNDITKGICKDANTYLYDNAVQIDQEDFYKIIEQCDCNITLLMRYHNIVFNGAPGTGKTYKAKQIAKMLDAEIKFVQFHPSYDYTDFVEGLRPVLQNNQQNAQTNGTNQGSLTTIGFERRDGHFKEFCAKAAENMAASMGKEIDWGSGTLEEKMAGKEDLKKFVFIIDEINRGDMSKIFGELFYSIECGYRVSADKLEEAIKENSECTVQTQYQNLIKDSKGKHYFQNGFFVPDNVYIIGTMNDIDRSVESMDFAMRRRFTFVEITPEEAKGMLYGKLPPDLADIAVEKMDAINNIISKEIGPEFQIGPAYFLELKDDSNFESLWKQRIEPLIKEYRRGEDKAETDSLLDELKKAYDGNQNP